MRACAVGGCRRTHYARGWCRPHYARWQRHGDVNRRPTRTQRPAASYRVLHTQLDRRFGRAADHTCPCGQPARQWAYTHGDPNEMVSERGLAFSADHSRYVALCFPCHRKLDGGLAIAKDSRRRT